MTNINVPDRQLAEQALKGARTKPQRVVNPLPEEGEEGLYSQSWFVMCLSKELKQGDLMGRDFLGGRVVVYRDNQDEAHVVSAYCPHMGADLACGRVVDNNLQCAFHKWEYDGGGQCVKTGIGEPPPPQARLYSFPVREKYGFVWAFNGEKPLWELPDFDPPYNNDADLRWSVERRDPPYECSPWVFCCNTLDIQHLIAVHGMQFPDGILPKIHDLVRWHQFGFDYDAKIDHQGGTPLDWQLGIRGTSFYWQQGTYDDFWFGFITGFSLPRAGIHDCYIAAAVERLDNSPKSEALSRKRLKTAMDLEIRTIEEDRHILNNIRFAPGHLIKLDTSVSKFFDYLRAYPRAHPSKAFIE